MNRIPHSLHSGGARTLKRFYSKKKEREKANTFSNIDKKTGLVASSLEKRSENLSDKNILKNRIKICIADLDELNEKARGLEDRTEALRKKNFELSEATEAIKNDFDLLYSNYQELKKVFRSKKKPTND